MKDYFTRRKIIDALSILAVFVVMGVLIGSGYWFLFRWIPGHLK